MFAVFNGRVDHKAVSYMRVVNTILNLLTSISSTLKTALSLSEATPQSLPYSSTTRRRTGPRSILASPGEYSLSGHRQGIALSPRLDEAGREGLYVRERRRQDYPASFINDSPTSISRVWCWPTTELNLVLQFIGPNDVRQEGLTMSSVWREDEEENR